MANSLRAKIKKLKHDGHIDSSICEDLLLKLDGHDRELRAKAIDEFAEEIRDWQIDIQDNEYDAYKFDFVFERIFEIAEQLKEGGKQ